MTTAAQVATAIFDRVSTISIANGYNTDIGLNVLRGRRRIDTSDLPCLTIIEGEDSPQAQTLRSVNISQRYYLEAQDECDPDHPNDKAHLLLKDLKRAVFGPDSDLTKTVKNVKYAGRAIAPREDGTTVVIASIQIEVLFVEDLTNP